MDFAKLAIWVEAYGLYLNEGVHSEWEFLNLLIAGGEINRQEAQAIAEDVRETAVLREG